MSVRISDGDIAYLKSLAHPQSQLHEALTELEQSRALVTELRALAERMRYTADPKNFDQTIDQNRYAQINAEAWLSELSSLLAAHDAQQAEGKGE